MVFLLEVGSAGVPKGGDNLVDGVAPGLMVSAASVDYLWWSMSQVPRVFF